MEPVSPVVPGLEPYEIRFGATQKQYLTLPALRSSKATGYQVISRWTLTEDERKRIAEGADIYLTQMTFGHEFQPSSLRVAASAANERVKDEIVACFGLDEELNERLSQL